MLISSVSGATYGTGITAIKLTALGRPQLLVSMWMLHKENDVSFPHAATVRLELNENRKLYFLQLIIMLSAASLYDNIPVVMLSINCK